MEPPATQKRFYSVLYAIGILLVFAVHAYLLTTKRFRNKKFFSVRQLRVSAVNGESTPSFHKLGLADAFSCRELDQKLQEHSLEDLHAHFERRRTQREFDPTKWNKMKKQEEYRHDPKLQRIDHILSEPSTGNDLVITIGPSQATSLFAATYGWPVLALEVDPSEWIRLCQNAKVEDGFDITLLPAWASDVHNTRVPTDIPAPTSVSRESTIENPARMTARTVTLDTLAEESGWQQKDTRIKLLDITVREGELEVIQGASHLLDEGRIDHVIVSLHLGRHDEDQAINTLALLLVANYMPTDTKDRKARIRLNGDSKLDATEFLRELLQRTHAKGASVVDVWFYKAQ